MRKLLLIITCMIALSATAQIKPADVGGIEEAKAEPVYEVKEDLVTVDKVETKEVVTTITLDEISAQIAKYQSDIASNEAQIIYFQELIAKLEAEYLYLKSLGVLTEEEKAGGGK